MNTEKKIEQCLRAAPKPPAPDGLLDKLQADVPAQKVKTHRSSLRRWFAPTGRSISPWRVAAAAAIAIAVLLPLSYGATKLIKRFITISQLPTIKVDLPDGGALSPDGRHFAGLTWDSELTVIDTSTGERRNLAAGFYGPVVWSADGSEIAVMKRGGGGKKPSLRAVSLETGETRNLMENLPDYQNWSHQDWSPNGKLILAVRTPKSGVHSAVMVNLENKEETVLTEETEWPYPRFSPNGDWVSYVTKQAGRSILNLEKIDRKSHVKYTDFPGEIDQPLWSPDGSHVVFMGTQRGINHQYKDLWAMRVQGSQFVGAPFPVAPDVEQMEIYNWSQNGQLAYRTGFRLGGIFTLPVDLQTGKAIAAPRRLVRRSGLDSYCWSPDGKQIVTPQGSELSFISTNSGETIRNLSLPEIERIGRGISWSPDGKLIALCGSDKAKRTGIFLITVETSEVNLQVPLETGLPNLDPTWAPDSKTIAYGYKGDVYVVKVEDGKPRRITSLSEKQINEKVYRPVFTSDGNSVAYISRGQGGQERILATTIDGQETRQIFPSKDKKSSVNIFDLSPDGRHIVFTPGNNKIWCAPTDGGEPFKIGDISNVGGNAWAWMPKWSPKGDAITFIVTCEEYQYWVMENFLPAAEAGGR